MTRNTFGHTLDTTMHHITTLACRSLKETKVTVNAMTVDGAVEV